MPCVLCVLNLVCVMDDFNLRPPYSTATAVCHSCTDGDGAVQRAQIDHPRTLTLPTHPHHRAPRALPSPGWNHTRTFCQPTHATSYELEFYELEFPPVPNGIALFMGAIDRGSRRTSDMI